MAGIKITLVDDVSSFLRGMTRAEDALDDVAGALDDVARDGDKATEKMERSFRDLARAVSKTGNDIGDDVTRGVKRADATVDEFKDEARANFSEIASSFDGSMDSIVDLAQGTFGGLAGSIAGPVGLALGALAAAGGGFAAAWKTAAEESKAAVQSMYDDMSESGANFLSSEFINQRISDIVSGSDDAATSFARAQEQANLLGVDVSVMLRAWAGDAESVAEVTDILQQKTEGLADIPWGETAPDQEFRVQLQETAADMLKIQEQTAQAQAGVRAYRDSVVRDAGEARQAFREVADEYEDQAIRMSSQPVKPVIRPQVDTTDADRQLNEWMNRRRRIALGLNIQQPV